MTAHLAVAFAEGAASIRELLSLADERGLRITCVPGAGFSDARTCRILETLGTVVAVPQKDLAAALREQGVEGVVTFADSELIRVAELCSQLGLPGVPVEAARTVRSKFLQRLALNAASASDVDVVRVDPPVLPPEAAALRYPAVLKPEFGVSSRDTILIEDAGDAARAVAAMTADEPFVLESLIPSLPLRDGWLADYISVESAVVGGEVRHFGVTDKLPLEHPFREGGDIAPSALPAERKRTAMSIVETAVAALGIRDTVLHTEIKLTEPLAVIEVNARLGGYVDAIYRRIGVGSPMCAAVDIALGAEPEEPRPASGTVVMRSVLPPADAARVAELPETEELMRSPGVWRVDRVSRPGAPVAWQEGTAGRVMDVWLDAPDHDELRRRLELLEQLLERTVRYEGSRPGACPDEMPAAAQAEAKATPD